MENTYFTIVIPYVPREFRTEWHPAEDVGPFSTLTRGAFKTVGEAIQWAQNHLNGTPYSVKLLKNDS